MKKSLFVFSLFLLLLNTSFFAQNSANLSNISSTNKSVLNSILGEDQTVESGKSLESDSLTKQLKSSAKKANTNTAVRCFKLAENCMVGKDWRNALSKAEMGLSYDDTISDLIYIKAAAKINLGETKYEVKQIIEEAFEKNNWVGYSKNGARILYADLLCDTGFYKESLEVLDSEPFIYSADAEIIRIKNFYRLGTEESYNQARLKINSSRRVYSSDARFVNIFFNYEVYNMLSKKMEYGSYEIPELVQIIADSYIAKIPDYSNTTGNIEVIAAFFATPDLQKRLTSSIYAKNNYYFPLFSLLGLQNGVLTEQQALDLFIKNSGTGAEANFDLLVLETLVNAFTDADVKNQLTKYLNEYDGIIYLDDDKDLQQEMVVKYSLGRPAKISYDYNNDGVVDFVATCDYGTPVSLKYFSPDVDVEYDQFPYVKKISLLEKNTVFNFLYNDYVFEPIGMVADKYVSLDGFSLYLPDIKGKLKRVVANDLIEATASIEIPIDERPEGKIVYTMLKGQLTFAKFYEGNKEYAYCDFEEGLPFVRFADYDSDGYYETYETYDVYDPNGNVKYDDNKLVVDVFSKIADAQNIYLKEVQIDRNLNTKFEYAEIFTGNNGRICLWDYDDDGICDIKYTNFPYIEGESIIQETVFYSTDLMDDGTEANNQKVVLTVVDDVPLKLLYEGKELMIFAGENKNFYWLENKPVQKTEGDFESFQSYLEEKIIKDININSEHGAVKVIQIDDYRMLVIKVFEDIFCNFLFE